MAFDLALSAATIRDGCSLVESAMSEKKPIILRPASPRRLCPICGKASYSASGTHPQCSLARADAKTREARKAAGVQAPKPARKSWSKACPKCQRQVPARRMVCDCGHTFQATGPVPAAEAAGHAKKAPR
jgi:endogenous inhibitor of DNA gyrase (YacG/DUF329 family)